MDYEENEMTFDFQEENNNQSGKYSLYRKQSASTDILHGGEDAVHYTIYTKLDDVAESLQNKGFCRIHKSYHKFEICRKCGALQGCAFKWKKSCNIKGEILDTRNKFACYRGEI